MNAVHVRALILLVSLAVANSAPEASHVAGVAADGHVTLQPRQLAGAEAAAAGEAELSQPGAAFVRRESASAAALQDEAPENASLAGRAEEPAEPPTPSWWSRLLSHVPWQRAANSSAGLLEVGHEERMDCLWGPWGEYQPCNKICGGGTQTRSRSPDVFEQGGGAACEGEAEEHIPCNKDPCPTEAPKGGGIEQQGGEQETLLQGSTAAGLRSPRVYNVRRRRVPHSDRALHDNSRVSCGSSYSGYHYTTAGRRGYSNALRGYTNSHPRSRGWRARTPVLGNYMQIDLGRVKKVAGTLTYGVPRGNTWVTRFRVQYSVDTRRGFATIPGIFYGNRNSRWRKINRFPHPVAARWIRLIAEGFKGYSPAMRAGLYVCRHKGHSDPSRAYARVAHGERVRNAHERKRWATEKKRNRNSWKIGKTFAALHKKLFITRKWARLQEYRRGRAERSRKLQEARRKTGEGRRLRVDKAEKDKDNKNDKIFRLREGRRTQHAKAAQYAEHQRNVHERQRNKARQDEVRWSNSHHHKAGMHEQQLRLAESHRKDAEKARDVALGQLERRDKAEQRLLVQNIKTLNVGEVGRNKAEEARVRGEGFRSKEAETAIKKLGDDAGKQTKSEEERQKSEDNREAWERVVNRKAKMQLLAADLKMKFALRKEADLKKKEETRKAIEKALDAALERMGIRVNATERWRIQQESHRIHQEMHRLAMAEEYDNGLLRAQRSAHMSDEERAAAERNRMKAWKALSLRAAGLVDDASKLEGSANRAEGNRDEEDARRNRETEAELSKLIAGEDELQGEEKQYSKDELAKEAAEKERTFHLREALGKIIQGEHWEKGLEVSRWREENIRQEADEWRQRREKMHSNFLRSLTGNATHDLMLRRRYEAEVAKAEKERALKLKAMGWDATEEISSAQQDEEARGQDELARLGAESRREHEHEEEVGEIISKLSHLEKMELWRRQSERERMRKEILREESEEHQVRELMEAAGEPGPPGPPGHMGPPGADVAVPAEAHDCSQDTSDPYCGRRRRSVIHAIHELT